MAAEEKHRNETPISFAKYGTDGKANIIAHDIDENKDYAAKLLTPAITFLGLEKENPFNKIYIANVTARVSAGSKKVLSYIVKDITDSQPPAPLSGVPVSPKNEAFIRACYGYNLSMPSKCVIWGEGGPVLVFFRNHGGVGLPLQVKRRVIVADAAQGAGGIRFVTHIQNFAVISKRQMPCAKSFGDINHVVLRAPTRQWNDGVLL